MTIARFQLVTKEEAPPSILMQCCSVTGLRRSELLALVDRYRLVTFQDVSRRVVYEHLLGNRGFQGRLLRWWYFENGRCENHKGVDRCFGKTGHSDPCQFRRKG